MRLLRNNWVQRLGALGVGVLLLWLAARSVDFSVATQHIGSFNRGLMLLGLVIWLFGYVLRGYRWLLFLNNLHPVRWFDSFRVLMIGFTMNNLLPLRAGEFVRSYLLHRLIPNISTSSAFATVAGERVFDGIAIVVLTYLGTFALDLPVWMEEAMLWSVIIFVAALVSFLLLVFQPTRFELVFGLFANKLPHQIAERLVSLLRKFVLGLGVLKSRKSVIYLFAFSAVIWLLEGAFYYYSALSFGIDLSFLEACFLMGILNLAIMVPAGPGGIGAFEYVTVQALLLFGVTQSLSFSYGIITHAVQNLSVILIGLYYLWRLGFKIKE